MSVKKSLSTKSIQSLIASVAMITGLIGVSSSAAISQEQNTQELINNPTSQNTTNTIQESTRSTWGCYYRKC